jgi:hypothetical protein
MSSFPADDEAVVQRIDGASSQSSPFEISPKRSLARVVRLLDSRRHADPAICDPEAPGNLGQRLGMTIDWTRILEAQEDAEQRLSRRPLHPLGLRDAAQRT